MISLFILLFFLSINIFIIKFENIFEHCMKYFIIII